MFALNIALLRSFVLNRGCVFYKHFVPNGTNNPHLNEN